MVLQLISVFEIIQESILLLVFELVAFLVCQQAWLMFASLQKTYLSLRSIVNNRIMPCTATLTSTMFLHYAQVLQSGVGGLS